MTSAKVITEALASLQAEQQKFKERMLEAKRAAQQREAESIKRNEALREKVHDLEQEVQDLKNKLEVCIHRFKLPTSDTRVNSGPSKRNSLHSPLCKENSLQ